MYACILKAALPYLVHKTKDTKRGTTVKHTELILLLILVTVLAAALISCGHTHVFEGWQTTTEPTCTATGVRTGTCACGQTATEPIPATGHGKTAQRIAAEPDCTNDGSLVTYCTVCSGTVEEAAIPARGHEGVSEIVREPTCKQAGREQTVCTVCEQTLSSHFLPMQSHGSLPYAYNGDATALVDGTATASCPHCDYAHTKTVEGSAALIRETFAGKNVSILGDSISTYGGISNGAAYTTTNSTIQANAVWNYGPSRPEFGVTDASMTWWQRTIDALGANRLVNNSYSGDKITDRALKGRCTQLHDDTGDNAGTQPDIIFVYLGTNDFSAVGADVGSVAHLSMNDIATKAANSGYGTSSVAEAFAVMLYRMKAAYPDAEIYCLTVLEKPGVNESALTTFNDGLCAAAALFEDVYVADIFRDSGIHDDENFDFYVPNNRLHPGGEGMRVISEVLLTSVMENSKYLTADFDDLLS